MSFGSKRRAAPEQEVPSGFRAYPDEGFQIQPPSNYWEGNTFIMPGINPGGPTMTSDLSKRFPGLARFLEMPSPSPMGAGPRVGVRPQSPDQAASQTGAQQRSPLQMLLQMKG